MADISSIVPPGLTTEYTIKDKKAVSSVEFSSIADADVWNDVSKIKHTLRDGTTKNVDTPKNLCIQNHVVADILGAHSEIQIDGTDIFKLIYPVGSIYMSVNATSPANLFGGTWARIQDTFLLAAGTAYTAGTTGGEASHTLTVAEMPSHTHTQRAHNHTQNAHTHVQNAHSHGNDAHSHGNDAHGHGNDAHNHTQNAHSHGATVGKGFATTTTTTGNLHTADGNTISGSGRKYGYSTNGEWKYATNTANATATNNASSINIHSNTINIHSSTIGIKNTTATNQNATATNNAATAVNDSTGGGAAFSTLPPYLAVYVWQRTA